MDLELLYSAANLLVLPAWGALLFRPGWRFGREVFAPFITPAVMASLYLVLIVAGAVDPGEGSFGSLAELGQLFSNPRGLLTGWTHYLVTDVFIGAWALRESQRLGIRHRTMVPVLLLLLMLLPIGLLLYFAIRAKHTGARVSESA